MSDVPTLFMKSPISRFFSYARRAWYFVGSEESLKLKGIDFSFTSFLLYLLLCVRA